MSIPAAPWRTRATTYVKAYMRRRQAWDSFGHDETDEWGDLETSTDAQSWDISGGALASYRIVGGIAYHDLLTTTARRSTTDDISLADVQVTTTFKVGETASGAALVVGVIGRYEDTDNFYLAEAVFNTDQTITIRLRKDVAASFTTIASATFTSEHNTRSWYGLTLDCQDTTLRAKFWDTDDHGPQGPDTWNVTAYQQTDHTSGGVGVRSFRDTGNLNDDLPIAFAYFSAGDAPTWVDVTESVLIAQGLGQPITGSTGRSTELAQIDESNFSFALKNLSGWFTPDNALSPYFPDWRTGAPLRWSETLGHRTWTFPDMWLEIPEVSVSFERQDHPEVSDRTLRVNGVDLLTRLKNAPEFPSNLAGYIVGEATAGALRAYWPLVDPSGSTYASAAGPVNQAPLRFTQVDSYSPVSFIDAVMSFGEQDGPPGDDATAVEFTPVDATNRGRLSNDAVTDSAPGDTGVATLVAWVYVPVGTSTLDQLVLSRDLNTFDIYILFDGLGGAQWSVTFDIVGGSDTALTGEAILPGWHLLAGQVDFANGDVTMWVDDFDAVTGNTGGSGSLGKSLDRLVIDGGESTGTGVRIAHVQLYIGDSAAFTREDFLAQYDVGINGWPQQTADARIRQICTYAGLVDGQLDLEESDSLIQPPQWSGQSPGALAVAAAATGGGILFTRGNRLIYHDRKHRFNL